MLYNIDINPILCNIIFILYSQLSKLIFSQCDMENRQNIYYTIKVMYNVIDNG